MSEPPNQTAANKLLRVLGGAKPLKYTVMIHRADGTRVEFQSETQVKVFWHTEMRSYWIGGAEYMGCGIMPWQEGMIILQEENPK